MASTRTAAADTRSGRPFSRAPPPRSAVNSSRRLGSYTAATSATPSISIATVEQKIGRPCAKFVVPSMGSNTQHGPAGASAAPPSSSARMAWSGNRSAMSARNIRSIATSTSVTRSMVPFLSIWRWLPNRASCMSPARTTASTAVVRKRADSAGDNVSRVPGLRHTLQHLDLHPALRRALEPDVVHEVANEKDAAAARLEEVFLRQRIGDFLGFEALALVADANDHLRTSDGRRPLDTY